MTEADERGRRAVLREAGADERERELLNRERRFSELRSRSARKRADAEAHAEGERQRERAAAGRRAAARERARAAVAWGPQAYGPKLLSAFAPLAAQLLGNDDLPACSPRC